MALAPSLHATRREGDATQARRPSRTRAGARAQHLLIEQILCCGERATEVGESLLQTNGKSQFRIRFESDAGHTEQTAADRLLDGLSGYLFHAYCSGRARLTATLLRRFHACAAQAIEQGFAQTTRGLEQIGGDRPAVRRELTRTRDRLNHRLAAWFSQERARLTEGQLGGRLGGHSD